MFKQILAQFFTKHCTKTKVYAQILDEILVDIQRVVYPPIVGTTVYIYIGHFADRFEIMAGDSNMCGCSGRISDS